MRLLVNRYIGLAHSRQDKGRIIPVEFSSTYQHDIILQGRNNVQSCYAISRILAGIFLQKYKLVGTVKAWLSISLIFLWFESFLHPILVQ